MSHEDLSHGSPNVGPVGAREVKPPRSIWTQLTECRKHGHEPTEWYPNVSKFGEPSVRGRKQYCKTCGARLANDYFIKEPEKSYVFVDRPWYPEALDCYSTEDCWPECTACGEEFSEFTIHASLHVTELDHRSRHHAERAHEDHYDDLCPDCWGKIAAILDNGTIIEKDRGEARVA